tara:strand:+ start:1965 stop:2435 length:471 start_codon:yes stop_codon:yes gene_type:complete
MEELNNPESKTYTKILKKQKLYINTRLGSIKNRYINDKMGCCGEKEIIAKHLNQGPAQNLVQTFFKFKTTKCLICNGKKGENSIRQLERAHCNILSNPRYDLLMMAINDLWVDTFTPIKVGDILKLFIQKHEICPIYMLCNICHNKYDNVKRLLNV